MIVRSRPALGMLLLVCVVAVSQLGGPAPAQAVSRPPNILFIMLDDVGADQLAAFNPAAGTAALTPNLNAIVAAGVKFSNFYAMPECSPSRVSIFTGRYPLRTGVIAAILEQNLPASQISPFEVTTPRVLAAAGYRSAMVGKYHLGGPENNPEGTRAPVAMGWDFFNGNMEGYPPTIDTSLGGQYTRDTDRYSCGFPTGSARGAAWFQDSAGHARCDDNQRAGYTGQQAVTLGGISALDASGELAPTCKEAAGTGPDFTRHNGYYVWPQIVADARRLQTPTSRQYMTTAQTDAAIAWATAHAQGASVASPWMMTVSYNAIHTSYQQPPVELYPPGFVWPPGVPESCSGVAADRILAELVLGAVDQEIGRLLVGLGLARREAGQIVYRPEATDTMVVIVGDNGTFYPVVKLPFDPSRAKGTAYETGVRTPLMVSGPLVVAPGRSVDHMVNAVDLFQLFGEVAGVDVHKVVPSSHVLDAEPVLAYLTNPSQPAVRQVNFSQLGVGLLPQSVKAWPCVLELGSLHVSIDGLYTSETSCVQGDGTWFGPTAARPSPPYATGCDIRAAGLYPSLAIQASQVRALRNSRYKLLKFDRASCDSNLGQYEFYDLAARTPTNPLGIDLASTNLLTNGQPIGLSAEQAANYGELSAQLQDLLASEPACYADGNLDKRVDADDWRGVLRYWGQPSVFDVNRDGKTDDADLQCVKSNFGNDCRRSGPGKPCK
jgi:arylsulfatase A-like enzyme